MKIIILNILFILFLLPAVLCQEVSLKKGMLITRSVKIKKGVYHLNGTDSLKQPVIIIQGNNITIDFNGAELIGSNDKDWPNEFYGTGIIIKGGKNITIKNAVVRGFKVAVMAVGVDALTIERSDFSYNWRQKLQSNRLREDVSDWMSYHHNENDEWLRYGAGIYLKNCSKAFISSNTITGGQCGLMMTNCNDCLVNDNDFSFNSALGIGMYRSSRNTIYKNRLNFNVRGYSHGIYNRGQDSAGILMFEQCNSNFINQNSVTHGGDGFFLWAGQTTMDKGTGGCNDNTIVQNNFSYAPTNGIEVTFSRNKISQNLIRECDHGIWGGYSFDTRIADNIFSDNRIGIAIEHGQRNTITYNSFTNDKTGIRLWARRTQPDDWGYAKYRDTRSMGYMINNNAFQNVKKPYDIIITDTVFISDSTNLGYRFDTSVHHVTFGIPDKSYRQESSYYPEITLPGQKIIKISHAADTAKHQGRKEIRITDWGPYDFRYPILWLTKQDSSGNMWFDVLGPNGKWKMKNVKGIENLSAQSGSFPASITAKKISDDVLIELEYTGRAFTTPFGKKHPENIPYSFSFHDFEPQITWDTKWYKWDVEHDPNKSYEQFKKIFSGTAIKSETGKKLDYTWWGEIGKGLPADSFATVATGKLLVPAGKYDLGITADDLVRVYIDGKAVIDFWDASKYVNDEDAHHRYIWNSDGKAHDIRVEHVENGGYATVIFTLKPI